MTIRYAITILSRSQKIKGDLKTTRKHLNKEKKVSQTIIKKCSKEFNQETIFKAIAITKLINKLKKAKIQ